MPSSAYQERLGAARRTSLALSRKQQREITAMLQQYADELSALTRSGRATSSQVVLQREVKELLHRLNEELARHTIRNSQLQARTMAQLQAEATATAITAAGRDADAVSARLGGVGSRAAQAVIARNGYADTFVSLRRNTDRAAEQILSTAALRGWDNRTVEKQLRLLVRGSEDIPPELLLDRRLISKKTLTDYMGIEEPTNKEVAAVRKQAGLVSRRARLIARTEAMNAEHEANSIAAEESPVVEAVQWNRSHRHDRRDSCDVLAEADLYGLGPGVYPTDAIPSRPHPRCLCFLTHFIRPIEDWDKEKKPGPKLQVSLKKVIRDEKLTKSDGEALRQSIGVGESRREKRRNLVLVTGFTHPGQIVETAAHVGIAALDVQRATVYRAVDKALSAIGVDVPSWGRVLLGLEKSGLRADQYLDRIIKLVELGAAYRIGKRLFGVADDVTPGVSMPTYRSGWYARHGAPDRPGEIPPGVAARGPVFAEPVEFPAGANGSLDDLTDALSVWSARQYNEHLTSIDVRTGKVVYYAQGDMTSVTPSVGARYFNGKRVHHNHPVWAVRYEDPETVALWSFSYKDINTAFTNWRPFDELVTSGPATFWLRPRRGGPDFRSKLWEEGLPDVRNGQPGNRAWLDLQDEISAANRWPTGTLDEYKPSHSSWPGPDDKRWIVFSDYDAWKEARLAGEVRAMLDQQYDAWVRDQTWKEWAKLYGFDYSVDIDPDFDWSKYHHRALTSAEVKATADELGLLSGNLGGGGGYAQAVVRGGYMIEAWDPNYDRIGSTGDPWSLSAGLSVADDDSWLHNIKRRTGQWWRRVRETKPPGTAYYGIGDAEFLNAPLYLRLDRLGTIRANASSYAQMSDTDIRLLLETYRETLGVEPDDVAAMRQQLRSPLDWAGLVDDMRRAGVDIPERIPFEGGENPIFQAAMQDLNEHITDLRLGPLLPPQAIPNFADPGPGALGTNLAIAEGWLQKQAIEHSFIFAPDGKLLVYRAGIGGQVTMSGYDSVLMKGAVAVHNHPPHVTNPGFSPADWNIVAKFEPERSIVVTRKYLYEMRNTRRSGRPMGKLDFEEVEGPFSAQPDDLKEWLRYQNEAAEKIYRDNVVIWDESRRHLLPIEQRADAITRFEAFEMISDSTNRRFAGARNIEYRRTLRPVQYTGPHTAVNDFTYLEQYTNRVQLDAGQPAVFDRIRRELQEEQATLQAALASGRSKGQTRLNARLDEIDEYLKLMDEVVQHDANWQPHSWQSPKWWNLSVQESVENAEKASAIATILSRVEFGHLRAQAARFSEFVFKGGTLPAGEEGRLFVKKWLAEQLDEWREETLPKLRRMGLPTRGDRFLQRIGLQSGEPYFPFETTRRLGEKITDYTREGLEAYVRAFGDELYHVSHGTIDKGRFFSVSGKEQLGFWFDLGDRAAVVHGARGDALPGVFRGLAKHEVQRKRGLDVMQALNTSRVEEIWDEVANKVFIAQRGPIALADVGDEFVPLARVAIDPEDILDEQAKALLDGAHGRYDVEIRRVSPTKLEVKLTQRGIEVEELRFVADDGTRYTHPVYIDPDIAALDSKDRVILRDLDEEYFETVEEVLKDSSLKDSPDVIWRGISAEEWDAIREKHHILSRGEYNIGPDEVGKTLFAEEVGSAASYAGGFAPAQFYPAIGRSSYIIGVRKSLLDPDVNPLTVQPGSNYVAIAGPINMSLIVDVIEVRPYAAPVMKFDLVSEGVAVGKLAQGGGSLVSPRLAYKRLGRRDAIGQPRIPATAIFGGLYRHGKDSAQAALDRFTRLGRSGAFAAEGEFFNFNRAFMADLLETSDDEYGKWMGHIVTELKAGKTRIPTQAPGGGLVTEPPTRRALRLVLQGEVLDGNVDDVIAFAALEGQPRLVFGNGRWSHRGSIDVNWDSVSRRALREEYVRATAGTRLPGEYIEAAAFRNINTREIEWREGVIHAELAETLERHGEAMRDWEVGFRSNKGRFFTRDESKIFLKESRKDLEIPKTEDFVGEALVDGTIGPQLRPLSKIQSAPPNVLPVLSDEEVLARLVELYDGTVGQDWTDWMVADEWLRSLPVREQFKVIRRVVSRVDAEKAIAAIVDGWAGSSSGNVAAIATQFSIKSKLAVERAAMKHMSYTGDVDVKQFEIRLRKVYNEALAKAKEQARQVRILSEVVKARGNEAYFKEQYWKRIQQDVAARTGFAEDIFAATKQARGVMAAIDMKKAGLVPKSDDLFDLWQAAVTRMNLPPKTFNTKYVGAPDASLPGWGDLVQSLNARLILDKTVENDFAKLLFATEFEVEGIVGTFFRSDGPGLAVVWYPIELQTYIKSQISSAVYENVFDPALAQLAKETAEVTAILAQDKAALQAVRRQVQSLESQYGQALSPEVQRRMRRLSDLESREAIVQRRIAELESLSQSIATPNGIPYSDTSSIERVRALLAKAEREVEEHYLLLRSFSEDVTLADLGYESPLTKGRGLPIEIEGRSFMVGINQQTGVASIAELRAEQKVVEEILRRTDFLIGEPGPREKYRLHKASRNLYTSLTTFNDKLRLRGAALDRSRERLAEALKDRLIEINAAAADPILNPGYVPGEHHIGTAWRSYMKRELGKDIFRMWKRGEVQFPAFNVSFKDTGGMSAALRADYIQRAREASVSWADSFTGLVDGSYGSLSPSAFEAARLWESIGRNRRNELIHDALDELSDSVLEKLDVAQEIAELAEERFPLLDLSSRLDALKIEVQTELREYILDHPQYALNYMAETDLDLDIKIFDEPGYKAAVAESNRKIRNELNAAEALYGEVEDLLDSMIQGMWEETQDQIRHVGGPPAPSPEIAQVYALGYAKKAGYDVVEWADGERSIIHGIRGRTTAARVLVEGTEEFEATVGVKSIEGSYAFVTRPTDHIVLMRGMKPNVEDSNRVANFLGRVRTVQFQPGNSFAFSPIVATSFTRTDLPRRGYISICLVPKEKILATSRTGFGCFSENEVIMLGGPTTAFSMLQPADHVHLQWWDFLHRLGVTGLADTAELESWRRFASAIRGPLQDKHVPDSDAARLLGWHLLDDEDFNLDIDIDEMLQEAYDVFSEAIDTNEWGTYFEDVVKYDKHLFDDHWDVFLGENRHDILDPAKLSAANVLTQRQIQEWKEVGLDLDWLEQDALKPALREYLEEAREEWFENLNPDKFWNDDAMREGFYDWYQETYFEEWFHDTFKPAYEQAHGLNKLHFENINDFDSVGDELDFSTLETEWHDPWADPDDLVPPTATAFGFGDD